MSRIVDLDRTGTCFLRKRFSEFHRNLTSSIFGREDHNGSCSEPHEHTALCENHREISSEFTFSALRTPKPSKNDPPGGPKWLSGSSEAPPGTIPDPPETDTEVRDGLKCDPHRQGRAKRTPGEATLVTTPYYAPGPLSISKTLLSLFYYCPLDPGAVAPRDEPGVGGFGAGAGSLS